jgi:hypothetical protein
MHTFKNPTQNTFYECMAYGILFISITSVWFAYMRDRFIPTGKVQISNRARVAAE